MENKQRSSFTGKIGFVLAAAGSAVGLGNIWRFPYLAAKDGGGIFLLVYIILALTFGFTLMVAEIAIGRKTGLSAIKAFEALDKRFSFIGWLGAIIPMIIISYYNVIGGWVAKYLFTFIGGGVAAADSAAYFNGFISSTWQPLFWFVLFMGVTAVVVFLGVEKGIEKVSKIMMPVLVVLTLFVAVYSVFLPGAGAGVRYYLIPDFSRFSINTIVDAMGQMFYSMSLAMGIMVTYGSYMKKDVGIASSAHQIGYFDTGIAFLAGMMIIPAVFAFSGGDESALSAGPGLMFITLPQVFDSIKGGAFLGAVFFLLVLFAALTSSISLMETVVSSMQDKFRVSRAKACMITLGICVLLGVPSSLGNGPWANFTLTNLLGIKAETIAQSCAFVKNMGADFLTVLDYFSNNILMPITALCTAIFVGWVLKPDAVAQEVELSGRFRERKLFDIVIRFVAPVCILVILISGIIG